MKTKPTTIPTPHGHTSKQTVEKLAEIKDKVKVLKSKRENTYYLQRKKKLSMTADFIRNYIKEELLESHLKD